MKTVTARRVFLAAFATHFVAVVATTVTGANPDASGDVDHFATVANGFARQFAAGTIPAVDFGATYDAWGIMLSPLWLLPGPSVVYARLLNGLLGALAACNVYYVGTWLHSKRAGAMAALPLIAYPSVLGVHSTILREAIVLFGLTAVARLYLVPSRLSTPTKYALSGAVMVPVVILRSDNLPVYLLVAATAVAVHVVRTRSVSTRVLALPVAALPVALTAGYPKVRAIVRDLAELRRARATGRTAYLETVFPQTVASAIAFGWIGAAYFLFSPFPWMLGTPMDVVVYVEGAVNLAFAIAAVAGARVAAHRSPAGTAALVVGLVVGASLYGLGTANVGTAVRHRQMVTWTLYLLGGIGIADRIALHYGDSSPR